MNEIIVYLVQTLLSLFLLVMLLRFLLQLVRADFYNPISQFVAKMTNPLVLPLRKILPSFASIDLASLLLALLLQLAGVLSILLLNGVALPGILQLLIWSALGLVGLLVNIYFFALLAMIILSWVASGSKQPSHLFALSDHRTGDGAFAKNTTLHGWLGFFSHFGLHRHQHNTDRPAPYCQ